MAGIRFKKPIYPISDELRTYLRRMNREIDVPVSYQDMLRFNSSITLHDANGEDTLWETLLYLPGDWQYLSELLRQVYAQLKVGGDVAVIDHLYIDRVDYCLYANTHPIRVRIVNRLNDLFDYFYFKQADASRIYGMELEHLLSPNKIEFRVTGDTLIEEHIQGIPGELFIKNYLTTSRAFNPLRLAKEFVKFNERSLVQLLGDMRRDNFVVEVIPDFDDTHFRLRAIDFDQQSYEGSLRIYMPQFFKENNPIIELGIKSMSPVLELQYQKEERARLAVRYTASEDRIGLLLNAMADDDISTLQNITQLKNELAHLYDDDDFIACRTMGEIVRTNIAMLFKHPVRKRRNRRVMV